MKSPSHLILVLAAITAVLLRFAPVPVQNFSAMGALAVLCGVHVRSPWLAFLLPLAARLVSDVILQIQTGYGFYSTMLFDYAAYGLIVLAGRCIRPAGLFAGAGTGLLSAAIFFVVSNFGVWCLPFNGIQMYPQTLPGLLDCYIKGLPFARGTFLSDVLLTPAFLAIAAAVQAACTQPSAAITKTIE
jgi:hypothetical protein